jgi:hypothetical protein
MLTFKAWCLGFCYCLQILLKTSPVFARLNLRVDHLHISITYRHIPIEFVFESVFVWTMRRVNLWVNFCTLYYPGRHLHFAPTSRRVKLENHITWDRPKTDLPAARLAQRWRWPRACNRRYQHLMRVIEYTSSADQTSITVSPINVHQLLLISFMLSPR